MKLRFPALGFLILTFAGWINRHQLDVIEYLKAENGMLCEMLGRRKLRFTQSQRRRLATKGKNLKRRVLLDIGSLVTPDTLLRWHRELISHKWDYSHIRNPGRPRLMADIARLIFQKWLGTILGGVTLGFKGPYLIYSRPTYTMRPRFQ